MFICANHTDETLDAVSPTPLDRPKYFLIQLSCLVLSKLLNQYPMSQDRTQVVLDNGYIDGNAVWIKAHSFPDALTGFHRPAGGWILTCAADMILAVLRDDTVVKLKVRHDKAITPPLNELSKLPFIHFFPSDGEIIVSAT